MVWRVLVLLKRALCFWERTGQLFFSVFFTLPSQNLSLYLLKYWRLSTASHLSLTNNSRVDSQKLPSYRLSFAREAEPHWNVSWPFTVHLAWCTSSGCWFTLPYSTDAVSTTTILLCGNVFLETCSNVGVPTSIHSSKGLSTVDKNSTT